jgi:transcriptional regulator with XRE-family HTH domain
MDNNLRKKIGSRIRKYRLQRNLTQEDLAEKANLHPTFIAHIELGRKVCSIKSLEKIANALKIPIHLLFTDPQKPSAKLYDSTTQKLISMIREESDYNKKLLISIASSLFKRKNYKSLK